MLILVCEKDVLYSMVIPPSLPSYRFLACSLSRLGDFEKLSDTLYHGLHIHVHERHAVVGILLHDGDEGQVPIDLAQHDGAL